MAARQGGFALELFKFSVYLSIPVVATYVFGGPDVMKDIVNHFKFVQYPPSAKGSQIEGIHNKAVENEIMGIKNGNKGPQ
mmetsp:Transcript_11862/g.17498  ORF Transcript_11862/g.17498 Transcript_11862/m.17498 type:complete len:80 (-) Transcript_11862:271-510(-)|eukprot:CAMPEP_0113944200 /NCGR_PEP_ID=MMETSP1339-20121228/31193_1 /TAXON_ID=94617 /ORGANISM="Fibrocapsa japonica" /LENGTH=79 /DNA_ID=CAMNT_0000949297 /DNA_START=41 /DNA_END=280 /DNA_ORIENTATION=+ /assembly_acc=CAM_ASM_000762